MDNKQYKAVPERLARARYDKNLSEAQVAELLHMSQPVIHKYETGKSSPAWPVLKMMSLIYGTSVDYLCGDTDDPAPDQILVDTNDSAIAEYLSEFQRLNKYQKSAVETILDSFLHNR